jgi:hypothetical protein
MKMNKLPLIYWSNKISLRKSAGQAERLSSLLAQSTIDLNPHQLHAVLFAFNSPLSRGAIFADEVGLGKTIEAGLVLSQLWLESKHKILIIVPASLRTQWREELEIHFNLPSMVLDTPYFEQQINEGKPVPMTTDGIYIASLPFVYKRIKLVEKQPWDLVVIDEAHRLRRVYRGRDASKMAFELRRTVQDKPKLLLTATPLQNDLLELYGLVSFIDDKLLGSKYFFKTRFIDTLKDDSSGNNPVLNEIRKLVLGPEDGSDFEHPEGVVVRTLRKQVRHYINFPPRHSQTIDFDPAEEEWRLYELVSSYLQRSRIAAIASTQKNLMILVYRKLLASSSFAIAPTLKHLAERLKTELAIRQKENSSAQTTVEEIGEDELIEELEKGEDLEALEAQLKERILSDFTDEEISAEIEELEEYHRLAVSIKENTKGIALVNALKFIFAEASKRDWPQKAVIFTESRRTQEYLRKLFLECNIKVTIFNGSNNSKEAIQAYEQWKREFPESALHLSKDTAIRQALVCEFKQHSQVFLTTEAGAEGLNLQFANIVVNYDLPWNPQRIEQRIGRCHRYGQRYETIVINMLNTKNYADKRLLELLQRKLDLFEGVFGASDEILGALGEGIDFENRILEVYQTCKTPEEIDTAFEKIQKELEDIHTHEIQNIRSKIIDHMDTPILQLFKKTKEEVEAILDEYDENLLTLCKIYFGDRIQATNTPGIFTIEFDGQIKPYLFREETEQESGKISRIHKDHPIIKHILEQTASVSTSPIPVAEIHYTASKKKMHSIERYKNKQGMLYLFKLTVEGIETDQALAPLCFIEDSGKKWTALSLDEGKFLIELPITDTTDTISKSPLTKEELLGHWNEWKQQAVSRFERRNERLYVREEARINRFWDSFTLQNQDKIEKVENEIKDLRRRKENTVDFAQIRELSRKIQQAELMLQKLKLDRTKLEAQALEGKQKDFDILNEKLELKKREELLAVAKFKII